MKALLDAMGGDAGPASPIGAALSFLRRHPGDEIVLAGNFETIEETAARYGMNLDVAGLSFVDCDQVIEPHDEPVRAIRKKRDSSMVRGLDALRDGEVDFMVSSGNTGALMAGAVMMIGRISGVERPGLSSVIPTLDHRDLVMLDLGAGVDIRPASLLQYALMGSAYARVIMGKEVPKVALLNIGTEKGKGDRLRREAYALLSEWAGGSASRFVGNLEARDLLRGDVDVVVTDGFTGNMVLKTFEGTIDAFREITRRGMNSGILSRLGAMLSRPALKRQFERYTYQAYGGATLLGVRRPVIKSHGNANATAIASALEVGVRAVRGDVTGLIERFLEEVPNGE
ncbi:MAG: phosphate acyltransferase PlsX [Bacillota bacterium]